MKVGHRIVYAEEAGLHEADLIQVSCYRRMPDSLAIMREAASACRAKGIPFVIHPVGFSLARRSNHETLAMMAGLADLALIVHDETEEDGQPLAGEGAKAYVQALRELSAICPVSIENAADSHGAKAFWRRHAQTSITLDIGHLEVHGIEPVAYIQGIEDEFISRIEYVHIHRKGELHGGIEDHWSLTPGCHELEALATLIERKRDISVILEINDIENTSQSLELIRELH